MLLTGCADLPPNPWWPTAAPAPVAPTETPAPPAASNPDPSDENPLKLVVTSAADNRPTRLTRLDVVLTALRVRVPRDQRARAELMWNHLREDVLDAATALRLHRNGLRVGLGDEQWWDAIRATLDAIPDVRSSNVTPVRLPPDYPLALELDSGPHEQTLFFAGEDGILTGETWPQSRNVLRISWGLNLQHAERIRLMVVPEVRQRLEGLRWIRSGEDFVQVPNYAGRAVAAAAFVTDLEPGKFLVIAPGEQAGVYGLVGNAFLVSEEDGRRYDSYVFLRADVNHVVQRD